MYTMMVEGIGWYVMILILCVDGSAIRDSDLCDGNKLYNPTEGGLLDYVYKNQSQWTNRELVDEGERLYVRYSCEISNYCSLAWFDTITGEPVEEEPDYIEFQDDKQVLVLLQARLSDGRNYTCKASQGKKSLEPLRHILVQVLPVNSGGLVHLTHPDCTSQSANIGDTVMFYCEYSVGTTKPKLGLSTYWNKQNGTNGTFIDLSAFKEEIENDPDVTTVYVDVVDRDGEARERQGGSPPIWVYNTTLRISNISEEAFGIFQVVFGNVFETIPYNLSLTQNPKPPEDETQGILEVLIGAAVLLLIIVALALVYHSKQVDIKLYWKDHFGKEGKNDYKQSDAYISYHSEYGKSEEDLNFVMHVLKVKLENQGYRVVIRDVHHTPGTVIMEEIVKSLDTCRRCILVISPSYITSTTGNYDIKVMMDQVVSCKKQIVPIIFKDVENSLKSDTNDIKLLKHIIENARCLKWPDLQRSSADTSADHTGAQVKKVHKKVDKKKELFCKELMLRMPPRPKRSRKYNTTMSQVEIISYEEKRSSFSTSSSVNDFSSIYPKLNSEVSSNTINMATVQQPDKGGVLQSQNGRSAGMYPVIT